MRPSDLDLLCINTIRFLSVDIIEKANSGHPGLPMGAGPMAYVLWSRFLRHNPENPSWWDRDRFVLSAGHGSALLYSLLHLTGYDLPLDQIERFRQWGSKTPGHPESRITPGVDASTGPLGQGIGNAVGMAIGEAHRAARYNRPGYELFRHFTYVLASDGDMMEGIESEASSLAGHLGLELGRDRGNDMVHEVFHCLGCDGTFLAGFADAGEQFFAGEFLMPPIPFQDHQPFVLHFLVGGETMIAGGTFAAAADGRAFPGGA